MAADSQSRAIDKIIIKSCVKWSASEVTSDIGGGKTTL